MKHPVIVGTDLASSSVFALHQGEERATREERPLVVVHVASPLPKIGTDCRANTDSIRRKIQRHVAAVTGRREGAYRLVIARGLLCSALARIATSQQGLLVIGGQMRTTHTRLFRTTAERIVLLARGSVLVARPTMRRGRVLVAIDHPLDARPALDFAIEEADRAALGLTVVHCVRPGLIDTLAARVTGATSAYSLKRASAGRRSTRSALRRARATQRSG